MIHAADAGRIKRWRSSCLAAGLAGVVLCVIGAAAGREQFFRSYLPSYLFWFGMGTGCLGVLMLHHVTGGAWGDIIRPMLEAGAMTMPLLALLFVPVLLGLPVLYPWARPGAAGDALFRHRAVYMNVPFFLIRAAASFALWGALAVFLRRWSGGGEAAAAERARRLSAPGLALYVLTASFCAVDWMMSLEPRWYSTIYGLMVLTGQVLGALALMALARPFLSGPESPGGKGAAPFSDLGNILLAFVMLWAYMSFSQYLIIWSGDIPKELTWYIARQKGGWFWSAVALALFHFFVPFALLLNRGNKSHPRRLLWIAALLLALRILDIHWLVDPSHDTEGPRPHWMDAAALLGVGALWTWNFLGHLARKEEAA
jgi:hypothetical protein